VAVLLGFLSVSAVAHGVAAQLSTLAIFKLWLWTVFGQFLGVGIVIATVCWCVRAS
jgi:hypothetical protein